MGATYSMILVNGLGVGWLEALSDEEAETEATRRGHEVLDIIDLDDGPALVVAP